MRLLNILNIHLVSLHHCPVSKMFVCFKLAAGVISSSNRCIEEANIVLSVRLYRVYFSLFLSHEG